MREFLLLFLAVVFAPLAGAQSLRAQLVGAGFSQPTFATAPAGDPLRLFVLEQSGKIRILRNGQIVPTPFLDLGVGGLNKLSSGGERGLLGLAFHPNYASNGYFFVNYTAAGSGATIVERYRVSTNPDVALASSGTVFLTVPQPQNNHNGGMIQFGPDGKLYIGMGDGGGFADTGTGHAPVGNGQALSTLHGKMLRLDVNLPAPHIPPDNPYFGATNALGEIWHLGLRNPWRFSFDPANGDLYIGDVGESAREEIHYVPAGAANRNFGWRCMEGLTCTGYTGCGCNSPALTLPVHEYSHNSGCAVIGGYVYRGAALCALQGSYLFADYCSSRVWSCRIVNGQLTQLQDRTLELEPPGGSVSISTIPSLARDGLGELYVVDADGEIYKIVNAQSQPDCDADGISDACELAGGAPDCDANGVPDTCQVASGSQTDCDNDGVMDSCEIAGAPTLDWNNNGALDSCECPGGAPPVAYCTAKVNSLGCVPFIQTTGYLSASTEVFFWIGAKKVISQRTGMLIYGYSPNIVPFQGGFWCLGTPTQRMPPRNSGGSQTTTNCTGQLPYEFNTYIASGADPALLQVGQEVVFQFWARDPAASFGSSLTNAVRAAVCQ
jgi:glucose/arabinose dehydrogenase